MAKMVSSKASTKTGANGPAASTKSKVVNMPKADAGEPKAKKAKAPAVRKFVGKTTGLGIQAFQNKLMKDNFKAKLTDEQLAGAMRREFPSAVAYTVGHVRGIRSAWNKGKHGNEVPVRPLPEYDAQGNVVKGRSRSARLEQNASAPTARKARKAAPPVDEAEDEDEIEDEDVIEDEEDEEEDE